MKGKCCSLKIKFLQKSEEFWHAKLYANRELELKYDESHIFTYSIRANDMHSVLSFVPSIIAFKFLSSSSVSEISSVDRYSRDEIHYNNCALSEAC